MSEEDNEIPKVNKNLTIPTWAIWAIPSFVVVVWLFNLLAAVIVSSAKVKDYGQFGDLFGVSNSLIAGLALVLVALGVHFQKQELEKTKEILEEQSKITAAQEAALKKQNEATERQMFENTFFKLIENSQQNLLKVNQTIYTKEGIIERNGIYALNRIIEKLTFKKVDKEKPLYQFSSVPFDKESWLKHIEKSKVDILVRSGHHFRNISFIFKFISTSRVSDTGIYFDIFLNSLSNIEVALFAHYCIFSQDFDAAEIIKKNGLLKYLNFSSDTRSLGLFYSYPPEAFGLKAIPLEFSEELKRTESKLVP